MKGMTKIRAGNLFFALASAFQVLFSIELSSKGVVYSNSLEYENTHKHNTIINTAYECNDCKTSEDI